MQSENKNSGVNSGLVPQPHGGALLASGARGNKGGGRPSSAVRDLCRLGFEQAAPGIVAIARGHKARGQESRPSPSEQIRAFDVLGKYGMGEAVYMLEDTVILDVLAQMLPDYFDSIDRCQAFFGDLKARIGG